MAKKSVKKPDLPEIKLTSEEKIGKLLSYFVQGILFVIAATVIMAVLFLLGIFVF